MGQVIHKKGDEYRIWSTNTDSYISTILTLEQVRIFSIIQPFQSQLNRFITDSGKQMLDLDFNQWVSLVKSVGTWEKPLNGNKHFKSSTTSRRKFSDQVKKERDFLLFLADHWEEISRLKMNPLDQW